MVCSFRIFRVSILSVIAFGTIGTNFPQIRPQAQCVAIATSNTPEKLPEFMKLDPEIWCYENRSTKEKNLTFIYKPDVSIDPALTALVEKDSNNNIVSITHASLNKGKVSYHKINGFINPLSVPLEIQDSKNNFSFINQPPMNSAQVENAFNSLVSYDGPTLSATLGKESKTIKIGVFETHLDDSLRPYAGYWWPHDESDDDGTLFTGEKSPLGKYDSLIKSWTGVDPGSRTWESYYHSDKSVPWGGHCNGWAASSVLFEEPKDFYWDRENKNVIFPSDIKGMLAENSFCVNWAFYGNRYWGNPGDEKSEIKPDLFHKVITYYIGVLQKPVAVDYFPDDQIDNHVFTGYHMTIDMVPDNSRQFRVKIILDENMYDTERKEQSAKAPLISRKYEYILEVNSSGSIISGKWISGNPDFLWVPLSPVYGKCNWRNPHVDLKNILSISNRLPKAVIKTVNINYEINRPILAKEVINIPLPPTTGSFYKIYFSNSDIASIEMYASGLPIYPKKYAESDDYKDFQSSSGEMTVNVTNLSKLEVYTGSKGSHFRIDKIEFYSGD